ncbi:MAG: helix-turn-helix transcriptional regulator [Bauldia sp.]|nr:helix-turn-helix transcriptional regulator [Bauldia sp.]
MAAGTLAPVRSYRDLLDRIALAPAAKRPERSARIPRGFQPAPPEADASAPAPRVPATQRAWDARAVIGSAEALGRLVRAARIDQGLPQQALADLAGVGRRFLSELENGKGTVELDKALRVAAAVGIDLLAHRR